MLELSKRKRMMIMEQLTSKRQRLPSAERRKLVENQYNQFVRTMTNFQKPPNNSSLNLSAQQSKFTDPRSITERDGIHLSYSPTVGDLPRPPTDRQALHNQFYETQPQKETKIQALSPQKMNHVNFYKDRTPQSKQQPQRSHDLNALHQEKSEEHSQAKIEDQQIHIPYISNSIPASQVNNSDAIFFTSQFKNYIERQPEHQQNAFQKNQDENLTSKQKLPLISNQQLPKEELGRQQKTLRTNKSGQSLVLSNDSSLKFSLNQSAVHEAIAKKLTHELVIDSLGESKYFRQIQSLAWGLSIKEYFKDLIQLLKQIRVQRDIALNLKRRFVVELMIKKEMKYALRKDQIKISHFREQKQGQLLKKCFYSWKNQSQCKNQAIAEFIQKRQADILVKSFRTLKMLLFDRKINNQIEMYYLSKIFYAFKSSIEKECRKERQRAYRLYFKNLKKRIFARLVEGVHNRRKERQQVEISDENYYFTLLRKAFDSWKQFMPFEQRYVRLAMTTHIELKQTQDKRLIQTKTFDFRELK